MHFYPVIRSIVFKLSKGDAPDVAQMNAKVQQMLADALHSDGVEERGSYAELGIDFEEKAFYDILKTITAKYDFSCPEDKLLELAKEVKIIVDDKAKYTDWSQRSDIKAELKVNLILLLADYGYPPIHHDEAYKEIFEQAENFKMNQSS